MRPPPTISIDQIPESEGLSLELTLDPAWLAEVLADTEVAPTGEPGHARLRLDAEGRDVTVSGEFSLRVRAECVACLEPVELPVGTGFQLNLEPASARAAARAALPDEVELTSDELDVDEYQDDRVDLAHWLREQVLLEVPLHPRHPEECPTPLRVEAQTSNEPTIDPRLMPLLKLSPKKE